MGKAEVAAVVVLYHPPAGILQSVSLLIEQVYHVVVVDNTTNLGADAALNGLGRLAECTVIRNPKNLGIAAALNIGIQRAISMGFEWVVTFDQDSQVCGGYIEGMLSTYSESPEPYKIGMLCPTYRDAVHEVGYPSQKSSTGDLLVWMSSGSMIKSEIYQKLGPFEDQFFIDYVDTEYALRMRSAGYKIVESLKAVLIHSLGNMTPHVFWGRHIYVTNHNPRRRYFITRNRLILLWRYFGKDKEWIRYELTDLVKGTVALLLFEQDRLLKAGYMVRGAWDAMWGRLGSQGIL